MEEITHTFPFILFVFRRKRETMNRVPLKEPDSALDMLTSNLNPILAYEVQQCWIDPKTIRIGNFSVTVRKMDTFHKFTFNKIRE